MIEILQKQIADLQQQVDELEDLYGTWQDDIDKKYEVQSEKLEQEISILEEQLNVEKAKLIKDDKLIFGTWRLKDKLCDRSVYLPATSITRLKELFKSYDVVVVFGDSNCAVTVDSCGELKLVTYGSFDKIEKLLNTQGIKIIKRDNASETLIEIGE